MFKTKLRLRDKLFQQFEAKIQSNSNLKDKSFTISGLWKKFIRLQSGYKVFKVDATWIRKNLCVYFGHGGHGLVHEFIPIDGVWISTHHYNNTKDPVFSCICKTNKINQKVTKNYFESTVVHEISECNFMKQGKTYWQSHQLALDAERQLGLLTDPYEDLI